MSYQGDADFNGSDTLTIEANDQGNTGSGGAKTDLETIAITVLPVNDAPTLAVPELQTFDTTTALTFNNANGNAITVDDLDLDPLNSAGGETDLLKITLTLEDAGGTTQALSTLTLGSTTGLNITGFNATAGGTVTFEGTKADIEAALEGLQVQVPGDEDQTLSLVVTLDDRLNGDTALAANGATVTRTIAINTSNDNDAPIISNPTNVSLDEDSSLAFTGGNVISIGDVDNFGASNNTVSLSVNDGTLSLTDTSLITSGANNSNSITLTGSLSDINSAISGLSYPREYRL